MRLVRRNVRLSEFKLDDDNLITNRRDRKRKFFPKLFSFIYFFLPLLDQVIKVDAIRRSPKSKRPRAKFGQKVKVNVKNRK